MTKKFSVVLGFILNAHYDEIEADDEAAAAEVAKDRLREDYPDMPSEAEIVVDLVSEE